MSPRFRRCVEADLPTVVRLFALPDEGNKKREAPSLPLDGCYPDALRAIADDPKNALYVAELEGRVVGAFHLTIIQYVAGMGCRVAMIENVIVDTDMRSRGVGEAMMRFAIERARTAGCFRVQLTSNKVRRRAHAFYARLGFEATHEGMKLVL